MVGTDLGRKKQAACVNTQKVGGLGAHPSPPPGKFFKMRCLEITSGAMFESKLPLVLPVAFGKQNS